MKIGNKEGGVNYLNVKYLFQYVELCKTINIVASWEGLKEYYNTNKKGV